jgi:F-type H+-transporting ATPase subunit delta
MSVQRIAGRYAKSFVDLAAEQNKLERVLEDVKSFQALTKNRDFYLLLKSPVVHASKKIAIINQLFEGKYDELTLAFLRILINKSREAYLPEIAVEFIEQYKQRKHISSVRLTTAAPLSDAVVADIRQRLTGSMHTSDNVELAVKVDPELIGGFVLEFDDKIYDASIAQKLDELRKGFVGNLYISQILAR